jgi:hypothetical protein
VCSASKKKGADAEGFFTQFHGEFGEQHLRKQRY